MFALKFFVYLNLCEIMSFFSDILMGMPSTYPGELESKIHWEHMRYLVAELDVKVRHRLRLTKIFERKIVNSFLPISFNICFGCSKEPAH